MQRSVFHILNGDALWHQLPESLEGDKIVFRESLIEGPVNSSYPEAFFKNRSTYFANTYDVSPSAYQEMSENEISKITDIPPGAEVHLWFEHDVFCQVNYWCCLNILKGQMDNIQLFYVGPPAIPHDLLWKGFGGMSPQELENSYKHKIKLTKGDMDHGIACWKAYANKNVDQLRALTTYFSPAFPLTPQAINAYIDSIERPGNPGKPKQVLIDLLAKYGNDDFPTLFRAFQEKEGIYGYGDLQVKRMIDEIQTGS